MLLTGSEAKTMLKLHEKYGPVVRTAPRQVSYTDSSAWKVIYGHKVGGKTRTFEKDPKFYLTDPEATRQIVTADDASHTRQRRILANSFSDKVRSYMCLCELIHPATGQLFWERLLTEKLHTEYLLGATRPGAFAQAMGRFYDHEVEGSHGCRRSSRHGQILQFYHVSISWICCSKASLMISGLMSCRISRMSTSIRRHPRSIANRQSFGEPLYMLKNTEYVSVP